MARRFFVLLSFLCFSNQVFSESQFLNSQNIPQLRQEILNRQNSAQRALKHNLESILKKELSQWPHFTWLKNWDLKLAALKNFQQKLDKISDVTLVSTNSTPSNNPLNHLSEQKARGRINIGWNLKNDLSKLEYKTDSLSVGLYHPRTLNAIRGVERFEENLTFSLNKKWDETRMTASFKMPWAMPYYQATLTKDFSTTITSTVSAQAPLKGTNLARKIELKIALNF